MGTPSGWGAGEVAPMGKKFGFGRMENLGNIRIGKVVVQIDTDQKGIVCL